ARALAPAGNRASDHRGRLQRARRAGSPGARGQPDGPDSHEGVKAVREPSRMGPMRTRVASAGLLAALALAAAGCGGNNPGTKATGASLIRSNVLAFVSVNSDLQSSQWSTVASLVRKFPSGSALLSQLQTATSSQGVNYKRDIAPALGPEVDIVVSSVSTASLSASSASFVV